MRDRLNYIAALLTADATATAVPVTAATDGDRHVRRGDHIPGSDPRDPRTDHLAAT
jgi:hypothetical protein